MENPLKVPFDEFPWADYAPEIRARETDIGGARWALVEYGEGVGRDEWCENGHRGYALRGEYEFDDGRVPLRAGKDEAFLPPSAPLGGGAHRDRNLAPGPTRLFLIDDMKA